MAWMILFLAGLIEVVWAVGLKYTEGFTRLWPSVITVCAMVVCYPLVAYAFKTIPVGTGYAVWTGIGVVGTTVYGIFVFKESCDPLRLVCIGMILVGMVGLKVLSGR